MSRRSLAVLVAAPLLVVALGEVAARLVTATPAPVREARLREDLSGVFAAARRAAACAVERGPETAASCAGPALGARIEGAGLVEAGAAYARWTGTPAEVPGTGADDLPHETIRTTGLRTSLLAVSARDPRGRFAVASFVLASPLEEIRFEDLLPRGRRLAGGDEVRFASARSAPASAVTSGDAETRVVPIVGPDGAVVGDAVLRDAPRGFQAAAWRARGVAAAAVLAVALVAALLPWGRVVRSRAGLAAALAALAGGRAALLVAQAPERLLPRELGSPSLYGSPGAAGLLSSPANLALTALFALAAALAVRRHARAQTRGALAVALVATAATIAGALALRALGASLARDARVPVLALTEAATSPGRAALLAGLALAVVAVGALAGAASHAARRAIGRRSVPARAIEIALVAAAALLAAGAVQGTGDRLALDRLRSEFAPRVIEQSAQRRVALRAAVGAAAQSETAIAALGTVSAPDSGAAYAAWLSSPLFHQGYMSSLDFVDAAGSVRSHFAFALPPFAEPPPARPVAEGAAEIRDEVLPLVATHQRYLHAEASVWVGGRPIGTVVGHVLDEAENLPFLPWVAPYLSAIGPGRTPGGLAGAPDYVLYGPRGDVVLHTLREPPAASPALREAASRGSTLAIEAGGSRWVGLPLRDGERLHLLLVPAHTPLDLLVAAVRLLLVVALAVGAAIVVVKTVRAGSPAALVATIRASFYRKLLAIILLASVVPLVGFALFLRGYVERRVEARFAEAYAGVATAVRRVVEDYAALRAEEPGGGGTRLNDAVLSWLRGIVGQEIHLYQRGVLEATSKPELFASGLLRPRLPGQVERSLVEEGLPYLVRRESLGPTPLPVAYARVDLPGPDDTAVVAVPLVVQQHEIRRAVERVGEMLMLTTVLLAALLALAAAYVARSVARPVRGLVAATERIARGDYATRLSASSRDEIAALVEGFNAMAAALADQRADLVRRRDYMEALLGNATTGVVSTDSAGRIVTVNAAAASLIGAVRGALHPGESLVSCVEPVAALAPLAEALRRPLSGRPEPQEVDLVVGEEARRLRLVRAPLPDPLGGPPGTLHLVDDVTDLMRSNQLAAWAEMARAIAHEIKNPLTPIQLSTEHLARILRDRGVVPSPEIDACLDTVLKQVRALREIAAEFGAYAKLPSLRLERIAPATFLREAVAAYRAALPVGVTLEERYAGAPEIAVDRRVLSRAVVNLVENALQAMSEGGTLTIGCAPSADGGVAISVSDTGEGLGADVRARLFEPYFSTKSSGTGLGLAIVRRAVEAHGGRIELDSAPRRGTTFRIVLPAPPPA